MHVLRLHCIEFLHKPREFLFQASNPPLNTNPITSIHLVECIDSIVKNAKWMFIHINAAKMNILAPV